MSEPLSPLPAAEIFDKMVDSVACYEADGVIVYANPATCRIIGHPANELVGQNIWDLFADAKGNVFYQAFERVARTGRTEHFANFFPRWNRWYDNQVYQADGRIWVIGRDVTDQKFAVARLEALATASRVFSAAANDARTVFHQIARHVADVLHDLCSIRLLSSDGTQFEAPVATWDHDPVFRALLDRVPAVPREAAVSLELLQSMQPLVMANMDPRAVAARIAPPSHRELAEQLGIHSAMVVPLRAQGRVLGTLSVCRRLAGNADPYHDADLKLLQELADRAALVVNQWHTFRLVEESRQQLSVIADAIPVLVSLVDRNQRYQFVNAGYEKWFALDRAQILGKPLREVLGPAAYEAIAPHVRAALAGQVVTYEARLPSAGGEREVRATYTPYVNAGQVEGFVALVQDITDRARHEAELKSAIATRDEFISIASHELRTPLTALDLQLDGLLRSFRRPQVNPAPDRILRKVEMAVRQTDRLTTLIDGMLNVSRIATGTFQLELERFDLVRLVREVVERFEEESERAGSAITILAPESIVGQWDRARVNQTMTNLLSNALKYGARKPVEVVLASDDERVKVVVRDEGIGISASDLDRIFNQFERAVSSTHYGGLGLGLYIARQIVAAHGGTIVADGRPGNGATFTVILPRQTAWVRHASSGEGNPTTETLP